MLKRLNGNEIFYHCKRWVRNILSFFEEKPDGIKCPECCGKKTTVIHRQPNHTPDPFDVTVPCPVCRGTGYVPEYVRKQ
jgi:DnaJ-class molecular chaperone